MDPTPENQAPVDTLWIDDLARLKVLADPLRVRIMEALIQEARTTKQVAAHLGEKTTKLYHHVDALEKAGFLKLIATRQNRGTLEKYYRAVARVFRADPGIFSADDGSGPSDAWPEVTARFFEQSAGELRALASVTTEPEVEPAALVVNLMVSATEAEAEEIREDLQRTIERIAAPDAAEDDGAATPTAAPPKRTSYRLVLGFYPIDDAKPSSTAEC
ncbi:MAG: winged helix-turn-helix domain-containing protein [Acidobacteriota bacterium]